MYNIFIIDDEADILFVLNKWLTSKGFKVSTFEDAGDIIENTLQQRPELILLDVNLKREDGRKVCKQIKQLLADDIKVILFSANPSMLLNYTDFEADGIINKPFNLRELVQTLNEHIATKYN